MTRPRRRPRRRSVPAFPVFAVILFALASALLGLAHRPVVTAAPVAVAAAFVLPDGSIPTICGTSQPGGADRAASGFCAACLLTAAPGLPPADAALAIPSTGRQVGPIAPASIALAFSPRGRPRSRAPPPVA